jgi:signal transduction histidine kinase
MEYSDLNNSNQSLVPVLTETEKASLRAYHQVSIKYEKEIAAEAMEELKRHPVFGKLINDIPEDIAEERRKISKALQKDAIMNDNWQPYVDYQIEQGMMYAKMGLEFRSWFEVVSLARKYLVPCFKKEYSDVEELLFAINGMNCMMDIGMSIIGEAYVQEKKKIIKEDKNKIQLLNDELEQKVIDRTAQLEAVNKELEAFSYSVSHDLRAPLRAINGYAEMLNEDFGPQLNSEGVRTIENISYYAIKMGSLIDELLAFSRLGRKNVEKIKINMNDLTEGVVFEMEKSIKHNAKIKINDLHPVNADYSLIHQVMFNLISNAVKYSSKHDKPLVEISSEEKDNEIIYSIKDNGAGFEMKYASKLFGVFQRLHTPEEFEGSGVGLAIVHRLVTKHEGKVWAEGKVNEGAKFSFTLIK